MTKSTLKCRWLQFSIINLYLGIQLQTFHVIKWRSPFPISSQPTAFKKNTNTPTFVLCNLYYNIDSSTQVIVLGPLVSFIIPSLNLNSPLHLWSRWLGQAFSISYATAPRSLSIPSTGLSCCSDSFLLQPLLPANVPGSCYQLGPSWRVPSMAVSFLKWGGFSETVHALSLVQTQ